MARRCSGAVRLLLCLALSGCLTAGGCGMQPDGAWWQGDGWYEALDVEPEPPQGLAWDRTGLEWPTNASRVASMTRHVGPGWATVTPGHVLVSVDGEVEHEVVLDAAVAMVAQLSREPDQAALRATLEQSRRHGGDQVSFAGGDAVVTPFYQYEAPLDQDVEPRLLWDERSDIGGGVRFQLDAPVKHAVLGALTIRAPASGDVWVLGDWPEGTPDAVVEEEIRMALDDAGLPQPDEMHVSGFIC